MCKHESVLYIYTNTPLTQTYIQLHVYIETKYIYIYMYGNNAYFTGCAENTDQPVATATLLHPNNNQHGYNLIVLPSWWLLQKLSIYPLVT